MEMRLILLNLFKHYDFELDVKQLEDGSIEKSISVSKLGDNGEVVEVYEGDQDELSELIPNSKLLN